MKAGRKPFGLLLQTLRLGLLVLALGGCAGGRAAQNMSGHALAVPVQAVQTPLPPVFLPPELVNAPQIKAVVTPRINIPEQTSAQIFDCLDVAVHGYSWAFTYGDNEKKLNFSIIILDSSLDPSYVPFFTIYKLPNGEGILAFSASTDKIVQSIDKVIFSGQSKSVSIDLGRTIKNSKNPVLLARIEKATFDDLTNGNLSHLRHNPMHLRYKGKLLCDVGMFWLGIAPPKLSLGHDPDTLQAMQKQIANEKLSNTFCFEGVGVWTYENEYYIANYIESYDVPGKHLTFNLEAGKTLITVNTYSAESFEYYGENDTVFIYKETISDEVDKIYFNGIELKQDEDEDGKHDAFEYDAKRAKAFSADKKLTDAALGGFIHLKFADGRSCRIATLDTEMQNHWTGADYD